VRNNLSQRHGGHGVFYHSFTAFTGETAGGPRRETINGRGSSGIKNLSPGALIPRGSARPCSACAERPLHLTLQGASRTEKTAERVRQHLYLSQRHRGHGVHSSLISCTVYSTFHVSRSTSTSPLGVPPAQWGVENSQLSRKNQ
jgi:hypothetical protein